MVNPLEEIFPRLTSSGYRLTSTKSKDYNCIAWAAGDSARWWWPLAPEVKEVFWPPGIRRAETLAAFRDGFASLRYQDCAEEGLEQGYEKIAIFANDQGIPLHAARQLPDGRWTSKLGEREDIEHALHDLEGSEYGKVILVMKRPLSSPANEQSRES